MEQQFLNSIVNVQPTVRKDINAPYSFLEWSQTKPSVLEEDLFVYYNRYVIEWFRNNKEEKISSKFLLRQKYLFLLDQLQLFFTDKEKNKWYKRINLADEKELLLSIPYFAKKLRKIALYYLKLRKRLKNVKLRYNSVGSIHGIEQEIYQHVLENFTSENEEFDPDIQQILPSLSALKSQLVVKVEEYYDDGEYFDKSRYTPLSGYIDIFHEANVSLFSSKGIVLSSDDWIFNTFSFTASAEADTFVDTLSYVLTEQTDVALYGELIVKLLSESKYKIDFPESSTLFEQFNIPLQVGNNYFYYPYGTTDTSLSIEKPVTPVSLSSLRIEGATAGDTLSAADTIFVKNGDSIKAAWLYSNQFVDEQKTISCLLGKNNTTSFIFPFPGYGLSAEDIVWTGSTFETEDEYQFLPPLMKAAVNEAYWSQTLPVDSTEELLLCETTLVNDGAKAGKSPDTADNIFIATERNTDTSIPRGSSNGAWLYRFEKASLPISSGAENVILWPYSRVDQITSEPVLQYLSTTSLTSVCSTIPIQKLDTSYFVAASSFQYADKIYKLENYEQTTADATECCWLSSAGNIQGDFKYFSQNGVSYLFNPGVATKFIWSGPTLALSSVFVEVAHQEDCEFLRVKNKRADWNICSCKQVYYSPYGHSEDTFHRHENQHADYICEAPTDFSQEFDIQNWKDASQNTFETSSKFAWYKTQTESTWGGGRWVKANGTFSNMMLETGKGYIYKRSNSRTEQPFPPYAVFKKFEDTRSCLNQFYTNANKNVKLIAAKKDITGQWVSANEETRMLVNPGDFLSIERQDNTTSFFLSSIIVERQPTNVNSIWSSSDYIVFDQNDPDKSNISFTNISWPTESALFRDKRYPGQSPTVEIPSLSAIIAWRVVLDNNPTIGQMLFSSYEDKSYDDGVTTTRSYQNIFSFTFIPPQSGTYSISVTAVDKDQNIYRFPNSSVTIPKLSVVPQYTTDVFEIPITTPTASILLEHALSGWNYTASDIGAKPYWSIIDSEKSLTTKYKGIKEWGYSNTFFDEYIPNVNPPFSPLTINYGNVIEYYRRNKRDFYWSQPITYKTSDGNPVWCTLNQSTSSPSNLSSFFDSSLQKVLQVFPTTSATNIVLSNNLNGAPVEIFYNALNGFVWNITAETVTLVSDNTPTSSVYYDASSLFNLNLQSRFNPNVATLPTLDKLYSQKDSGTYFITQNLGASQYINTNFSTSLKTSDLTGSYISEDATVHIGGRGLTLNDQPTIYTWEENNEWLKEPPISSKMAGFVKKDLTKTLQTFIPYQTNVLETSLGILNATNNFSPWGGEYKDQWVDKTNEPKGFTGIRSVSAWQNSQELNRSQKSLDGWVSDIYGNQYGLFKNWNGATLSQRKKVGGELWIKTNEGAIQSATSSLSSLFEQFVSNTTIYSELTGKRIQDIDCFFDTLMISTSSVLLLSKIFYDYDTAKIETTTDSTFFKQLTSNKFEFEQTWFLSQEKNTFCLFTETTERYFYPVLYKYEINSNKSEKQFPATLSDINALQTSLSAYTPIEACLTYNETTRTFGITYQATDSLGDLVFINIKLKRLEDIELESIDIYENKHRLQTITMPPIVLSYHLSAIPVTKNVPFSYTVSGLNNPTAYAIIDAGSIFNQINVNASGTFTGTITAAGLYHVQYSLSNQIGSTQYSLTLSAS